MTVHTEWRGQVLLVTLDRPERRNAVDHATLIALREAQAAAAADRARVLVLTGAPPAFCAGADLGGVEDHGFTATLGEVLRGFGELPAVCIAAVDGPALGAGMQLAAACDLRVATPASVFGIPAARLGLAIDEWTIERVSSRGRVADDQGHAAGGDDRERRGAAPPRVRAADAAPSTWPSTGPPRSPSWRP